MPQTELQQLSLKELRAYVLANRSDDEALRYYVDRMRIDPSVTHYSGGPDELPQLDANVPGESSPGTFAQLIARSRRSP